MVNGGLTEMQGVAFGGATKEVGSFASLSQFDVATHVFVLPSLAGGRCLTMPLLATGILLCADVSCSKRES